MALLVILHNIFIIIYKYFYKTDVNSNGKYICNFDIPYINAKMFNYIYSFIYMTLLVCLN